MGNICSKEQSVRLQVLVHIYTAIVVDLIKS